MHNWGSLREEHSKLPLYIHQTHLHIILPSYLTDTILQDLQSDTVKTITSHYDGTRNKVSFHVKVHVCIKMFPKNTVN